MFLHLLPMSCAPWFMMYRFAAPGLSFRSKTCKKVVQATWGWLRPPLKSLHVGTQSCTTLRVLSHQASHSPVSTCTDVRHQMRTQLGNAQADRVQTRLYWLTHNRLGLQSADLSKCFDVGILSSCTCIACASARSCLRLKLPNTSILASSMHASALSTLPTPPEMETTCVNTLCASSREDPTDFEELLSAC